MDRYEAFRAKGPKRDKGKVEKRSHYNVKIDRTAGRPSGSSRDWGDAPASTQDAVINSLTSAARLHRLNAHDTALLLAIVRAESGFNPDAANRQMSASGPGQFLDITRREYGITGKKRFDAMRNADAIVRLFIKCREGAEKKKYGTTEERDRWIYKYYHDGSGKGGLLEFKEFDRPDGVKQWIAPIEESIGPWYESRGSRPLSLGTERQSSDWPPAPDAHFSPCASPSPPATGARKASYSYEPPAMSHPPTSLDNRLSPGLYQGYMAGLGIPDVGGDSFPLQGNVADRPFTPFTARNLLDSEDSEHVF